MAALATSLASLTITHLPTSSSVGVSRSRKDALSTLRIECSSHPQKKATAKHVKNRPKKHQPYDKNRHGPTLYKRLPKPPPIWGFDTSELDQEQAGSETSTSARERMPEPAKCRQILKNEEDRMDRILHI